MDANAVARPIPRYSSTLVGRDADISLLESLIGDPDVRLVTITGIAGVGKTRLGAHIARSLQNANKDVLFVPLASVTDPALVITELASALDLQGGNLLDTVRTRLANWQGIVVLDNLEQVIDAAVDIAAVFPANPALTIIVTSQRPLQIEAEHVVRRHPLTLPNADDSLDEQLTASSMKLLLDRTIALDASLMKSLRNPSTAQAMAEICHRLDGIPLALELAATRLPVLSPEVVLQQLEHGQQILSSQQRDIPARHRTMQSAIAWSVDLLPVETRQIFTWLGAFTAGFDLETVNNLTRHLDLRTPGPDTVSELIDLGLIQKIRSGARPWYSMFESMREFCLAELNATGERHSAQACVAKHVVQMADRSEAFLTGSDSTEWIPILDRELPTIRSAVAWALAHADANVPMRVASGMWRYLEQHGRWQEVVSWIDQALEWRDTLPDDALIAGMITKMSMQEEARDIPGAVITEQEIGELLRGKHLPDLEVQYLLRSGSLALDQQKLEEANERFHQALELAIAHDVGRNATIARGNIGIVAHLRGDHETAETYFLQVRTDLEAIGDRTGLANILSNLAATASFQNKPGRALEYLDESIVLSEELGLKRDLTYARLNQFSAFIALGNLDAAADAAQHAIELSRELNYRVLESVGFVDLAEISLLRNNFTASGTEMLRALELVTPDEGARSYIEIGLLLADALAQIERYADAAAILAKSLDFAEEVEFSFDWGNKARINRVSDQIQQKLGDFRQEQDRGRAWTIGEFVRNLTWFARRTAAIPSGMLVKVLSPPSEAGLTQRENQIMQLLIEGQSTRSMADHLSVSPRTVTTHIGNIMAKLEVSSRAELVAKVLNIPRD